MLKKLLGFGREKREAFNQRVSYVLSRELEIDTDYKTNPWLGRYTGYVELMSEYFYKKRTPEHCALAIALIYLKGISGAGAHVDEAEAASLALKLVKVADGFAQHGYISPAIRDLLYENMKYQR